VHLVGIPVRDDLIHELVRLVGDQELADKLETAYGREVKVLALDIPKRETIIRALDDPPPGLEELRGVLLREHGWRRREGALIPRTSGFQTAWTRVGSARRRS